MMSFIILLLFIFIVLIYNYYVHYGKKGRLINLVPGPTSYPIIGNISFFIASRDKRFHRLVTVTNQYSPIFKVWGFFLPIVFIHHPDDLQKILSKQIHMEKSLVYEALKPWMGTGLLTSGGAKWHSRRRILTPAFHFNILQQFVENFIEESKNMTNFLKNTEDTVVQDLMSFISEYTLNAICETAMGISLQNLGAFQKQYRKAIDRMSEFFIDRLITLFLPFDWIFYLTPKGREALKLMKILHGFTERVIAERKYYHERTSGQYLRSFSNGAPAGENNAETIGTQKKRLAMLDLLIAASKEGQMTDLDIREEVDTFMAEGYHTIAISSFFILALLAEHKEIQDHVRNEVNAAIRENDGKITMKVLQQLSYLNRCIKEGLRLYPTVHIISRRSGEDVKLQSYLIPAGTTLALNIHEAHRDPHFWPNPEIFDPDRFLPENIQNRHPYSYIPFSAGARNCIGQQYANLKMKAMIASLIYNFYLEPVDYLKNVRLQIDAVLHPIDPFRIKFVPIYETKPASL